jgi:hypothetical protein
VEGIDYGEKCSVLLNSMDSKYLHFITDDNDIEIWENKAGCRMKVGISLSLMRCVQKNKFSKEKYISLWVGWRVTVVLAIIKSTVIYI